MHVLVQVEIHFKATLSISTCSDQHNKIYVLHMLYSQGFKPNSVLQCVVCEHITGTIDSVSY